MKFGQLSKPLALLALTALAACGGSSVAPTNVPTSPPATGPGILARIVGVGDSLTAGYQSGALLGAPCCVGAGVPGSIPNPLATGTAAAGLGVTPGQQAGFWAQFYAQATGATFAFMSTPNVSPLPLIGGPGLGNQIVNANPALTGGFPFGTLPTSSGCSPFNQAAFSLNTALSTVREQPAAATVYDLGVPGITMHEAITMNRPTSPTCLPIPGATPTVSALQAITVGQSLMFNPVLGNFNNLGANRTELNAAVSLRPTLATVWLGANDLLQFAFSGGQFKGGNNSVAQVQNDTVKIVTALQKTGTHVIVANLPDVLLTPQFMSVATPPSAAACQVQTFLVCVLQELGLPQAEAAAITAQIATQYNLAPNGYLTESGAITAVTQILGGKQVNLDPTGPGSGLGGNYLTPAFAAQVQALNNTFNTGIGNAAAATKVPLVDVKTIFEGIASGNPANPYFAAAASVSPGKCCTLAFGGGLVSFDGLHPSNTGYAFIANAFIQAADTAYGQTIAPINVAGVYNGTGYLPYPDPYAKH
ncbi:MAG: SGNH/GDSL hydrolase family protein [Vulcanimicrobiaceae bacterium]